jgi:hypothetical protein
MVTDAAARAHAHVNIHELTHSVVVMPLLLLPPLPLLLQQAQGADALPRQHLQVLRPLHAHH